MGERMTRRTFAKAGAAAAVGLAAASASKALGANERIRLGFIGVGNRGSQLLNAFRKHDDAEIVAFCDVYTPYLDRAKKQVGGAATYTDFRRMLDQERLDAVVIATPDHWHAIQTITACDAGKDCYV